MRLRLAEPGAKWLQGDLLRLEEDSLSLVTRGGNDTLTLATASVAQVEVSRGLQSLAGQGLAIGAGVGAGLGLILSAAAAAEECQGFDCYEVGPGGVIAVTALLAAAGAGLGGLIGAASHRERWAQVPPPWVRAQVRPASGRLGVAVSVPF